QDAKIFQSAISPKGDKNPRFKTNHRRRASSWTIPSDFVVAQCVSDGASSSHRDVLLLPDVGTTSHHLRRYTIDIIRNNDIMGSTQHYQNQGLLRRGATDALLPRPQTEPSGSACLHQFRPRRVCNSAHSL